MEDFAKLLYSEKCHLKTIILGLPHMIDVMHVQRDRNAKIRTKFVVNLYIDLHTLNFIILDRPRFFGLGFRMYVEM